MKTAIIAFRLRVEVEMPDHYDMDWVANRIRDSYGLSLEAMESGMCGELLQHVKVLSVNSGTIGATKISP